MKPETYDRVIEQGKKEGRKKSPMAAQLIERSLPPVEEEDNALSYQQKIADQLKKK